MTGAATFPLLGLRRSAGVLGHERTSARRGDGYELASSRPYEPGDNVRAIDWRASARLSSARNTDEFVVREHFAEDRPRVVLVVDRRPAMSLYPSELPWLHKPAAVVAAGRLIVASAVAAQGLTGYLDLADGASPRWLPPGRRGDAARISGHELATAAWTAAEDNLARALRLLTRSRRDLPRGTFVFVLSDFLATPPWPVWRLALELGWDLVPVILQDPCWERSFPAVGGLVLPFAAPAGPTLPAALTRREAQARRSEHELRFAALLDGFARLSVDPVLLPTHDPDEILAAFLEWHRRRRARLGRR